VNYSEHGGIDIDYCIEVGCAVVYNEGEGIASPTIPIEIVQCSCKLSLLHLWSASVEFLFPWINSAEGK
jgi:hypothetical protein